MFITELQFKMTCICDSTFHTFSKISEERDQSNFICSNLARRRLKWWFSFGRQCDLQSITCFRIKAGILTSSRRQTSSVIPKPNATAITGANNRITRTGEELSAIISICSLPVSRMIIRRSLILWAVKKPLSKPDVVWTLKLFGLSLINKCKHAI